MTWLLCNENDPDTHRERTQTVENNIITAHAADAIMKDHVYFISVPPYNKKNDKKNREVIPVTDSMKMAYSPTEESEMAQEKGKLEPAFYFSQSAAIRFWARVHDLREDLEGMGERGKKWDGMKTLLESLKFGVLSLTLMDEKGEIVTTKGREIMDIFDKSKTKSARSAKGPAKERAKELVVDLIKGPKEMRKDALLELEQYLATLAKARSSSSAGSIEEDFPEIKAECRDDVLVT